ncbi:Tyrosine-protein kinase etk [Sporomusa silvacetica DSM 10669]|uniref:Tyrosine-protein kinase etk n=1 Tax=Sporomusa silvacetica DSM 10669 TaxID=1123289 RepID=A0ABZ3IGY3_9FIRM|nr:GumC family protein [Sporomusa silvacetica]OZC21452.1 tyrosine-protein kinase etk [Sporomusa silvacetica DSM 10669]
MAQINNKLKKCKWLIKKRYGLIIITCLIGMVFALIVNLITPPTYEAVTSLRVKQSQDVPLVAGLPGSAKLNVKQTMANYAAMLKSRTLVQAAIDKIYKDKTGAPRYEQLVPNITIKPAKEADVLYIAVQSSSPLDAQMLANALSDSLISLLANEQGAVREFIGQRLRDSKQELEQAEGLLEKYKREQKMTGADVQSRAMTEKLAELDKMVAENTVNLVTAQAKLNNAEQQLAGQKPVLVADNAIIQQYKAKLAELEVELASVLPKYAENHPKVLSLRAGIAETRTKLNEEVAHVLNAEAASGNPINQALLQEKITAEADISAASAQKNAIENILANSEKDMAALPAKEQGITRLLRQVQVSQEIYIMLDKRYEEARITEVMQPRDVKVLDAAITPQLPVKSPKTLILLSGMVLGLFVGTTIAFLLEYTKQPILSDQEAKELLRLPVLGIIPDFGPDSNFPKEAFSHRVRRIFSLKIFKLKE